MLVMTPILFIVNVFSSLVIVFFILNVLLELLNPTISPVPLSKMTEELGRLMFENCKEVSKLSAKLDGSLEL